jgi:predicted N-acyltransferase
VIGKLRKNFDNQWTAFLPKVRNNYRKAVSSDLIFKIFNDYDINEDAIKIFYNIYTETMIRHNAKAIYFFTLDYFKNLILNNLNEFALAVIFKDNNPISVELIIKRNDTIFAFLGGTDANYYSYRPNDFLRVEVIKWAIKSNYNYYVLGGGLNDGDGLYKSKKGFFPKDEDEIFYTGRKIINHEVYENLCKNQMANYSDIHKDELKNYFFPLYRFNNR